MIAELIRKLRGVNCNAVLRVLGIDATVIDRTRVGDDLFYLEYNRWYDMANNEYGDVVDLAVRKFGRDDALKELCGCVNAEWDSRIEDAVLETDHREERRRYALHKLRIGARLSDIPDAVREQCVACGVSDDVDSMVSFVPSVEMVNDTVSNEERALICPLADAMPGKLVIWDLVSDFPVGCWLYDLSTAEVSIHFAGACINSDALKLDGRVLVCQGAPDLLALTSNGIPSVGCASYRLSEDDKGYLGFLLRCRGLRELWDKTIFVLSRAGGVGAGRGGAQTEVLSWLFEGGVSCRYANNVHGRNLLDLKAAGEEAKIKALSRQDGRLISLHPYFKSPCHEQMLLGHVSKSVFINPRILDPSNRVFNPKLQKMANRLTMGAFRRDFTWDQIFDKGQVELMYTNTTGIHVLFREDGAWRGQRLQTFSEKDAVRALRRFRILPVEIDFKRIALDFRRDVFIVGGDQFPSDNEFNRYVKTTYLSERLEDGVVYTLPQNIKRLLDNLGEPIVVEYLLNLLAYYVQTFTKPQMIPYLTGGQGTGKGTLAEVIGMIIGHYTVKNTNDILEKFSRWKTSSAVVFLDEIVGATEAARRKIEQACLPLINVQQSVRAMWSESETVEVNNLVIIANNSSTSEKVFRIASDDRRYLVVSGGKNRNLAKTDWWDRDALLSEVGAFARHLRTRPVDMAMLVTPPLTEQKRQLIRESMPEAAVAIDCYLRECDGDGVVADGLLPLTQIHTDISGRLGGGVKMRPQDIKSNMEAHLGLVGDEYWCKPNNKTHFRFANYYEHHLLEAQAGQGNDDENLSVAI